ncbi:hypothetical protein [Chroococcidiopsis sp. TS-821]|uniref:hypothetical protein n=1 Tax=Chroococcidiopsis sp. TS-821 TaxID=1378066 RepID=UPI00143D2381|nr:hypothetical protein [Chroococcidiopsis sp. TS-821]
MEQVYSKLLAGQNNEFFPELTVENVVVTPHNAVNSREVRELILQTTADRIT